MSTFRRLGALLLASTVLIGIPYVLLWQLPWPQLDLTWQSVLVHLRSLSAPPGVPMALLITVLWAVWGLYGSALAAEALARIRGGALRIRPLGPLQIVAATALGASVAAPASAMADTVQTQDVEPGAGDSTSRPQGDGQREDAPDQAPPTPAADPGRTVERSRTVAGFELGSAELTGPMRQDLSGVADLIRDFGGSDASVRITGHTDPSGTDAVNLDVSRQRADSAADYLRSELGEDAPPIETDGVGSQQQRDGDVQAQRRVGVVYQVAAADTRSTPEAPHDQTDQAGQGGAAEQDGQEEAGAGTAVGASRVTESADAAGALGAPAEEDTPVVVLEVPDTAAAGALAVAGIVGGYAAGRRNLRVPGMRLSLPRMPTWGSREPERPALPPVPDSPEPSADMDDRVTVELDHVPGIGITGPGSRAAARRLVVNALGDSAQRPARILMTGSQAVQLLGLEAYGVLEAHPCEPVQLVDSMGDALAQMQRELHERSADPDVSAEGRPLVLVTGNDREHETALSGLLLHGQRRGITAVVIGRWPLGGSCHIAQDGLITETSPPLNPLFHAAWPGAAQSEVVAALRAYRHSRPAQPAAATGETSSPAPAVGVSASAAEERPAGERALPGKAAKAGKPRRAPVRSSDDHTGRTERGLDPSRFTAALNSAQPGGPAAAEDTEPAAGSGAAAEAVGAAAATDEAQAGAAPSKAQSPSGGPDGEPVAPVGPVSRLPRRGAGAAAAGVAEPAPADSGEPAESDPATSEEAQSPSGGPAGESVVAAGPVSPLPRRRPGTAAVKGPGTQGAGAARPASAETAEPVPAEPSGAALGGDTGRARKPAPSEDASPATAAEPAPRGPDAGVLGKKNAPAALSGTGEAAQSPAGAAQTTRTRQAGRSDADAERPTGTGPAEPVESAAGTAEADTAEPDGSGVGGPGRGREEDPTARSARVRRMRRAKARGAGRENTPADGGPPPEADPGGASGAPPAEQRDAAAPPREDRAPGGGPGSAPEAAPDPAQEPEQSAPAADDGAGDGSEPDERRLPRKPRKAGRGRNWRPRETT